jgi:hypothetical protein
MVLAAAACYDDGSFAAPSKNKRPRPGMIF